MSQFQSTRPRGARLNFPSRWTLHTSFNPRAHAGRDRSHYSLSVMYTCFNPRAHAGRDNLAWTPLPNASGFQSTRPRGARRLSYFPYDPIPLFQSTRPRGARHFEAGVSRDILGVSIHAPTRGATVFPVVFSDGYQRFNPRAHAGRDIRRPPSVSRVAVSIHAPTRGATIAAGAGCAGRRFNPRAHAGRDTERTQTLFGLHVSIHAPTRGATAALRQALEHLQFQSTRPRGARPKRRRGSPLKHRFQSTRPRGARLVAPSWPRCRRPVSIHAPTRGATRRL